MYVMWMNQEVDALVAYRRGLQFPSLQAIRWNGRRIDIRGTPRIERRALGLHYDCTDGSTRYAVRFEPRTQKWYLEGLDDSGIVLPNEEPQLAD